ncbi:LysR family transcriptional regulator [Bowmanella sp. JS7-9]|uniref:LysR family transcriptional regulator n=1 Tax=Pseudobowmanella zhangzhouensis TaxID=1537679 RepID=A0ABW1XGA2_9ALTE|nr:LysR family transcriptional regulator [Bowmanella sp. JS7-9]TBX24546.1 LysR family transcriptional regulator [Bowmanella sp. JS7-9]
MLDPKTIAQLDLNLLKVFEVLYQQRNMSAAAQILCISPSAVSHAMRRLRTTLQDDLFVRQGQRMQPTPACERIAPALIAALTRLREVLSQCGEFSLATSTQTFVLAMHDAIEAVLLPALLPLLQSMAPNTRLHSVRVERDNMPKLLASRQLDMAIDVALPLKAPILHRPLSRDKFAVLMRRDHPLATGLNQQTYLAARHITVSSRASGPALEDIGLLQQGVNRDIHLRCQSYHSARHLVSGSDLLLTLPWLIGQHLQSPATLLCDLPLSLAPIDSQIYWHQQTDQDPALSWLRAQIEQLFVSGQLTQGA